MQAILADIGNSSIKLVVVDRESYAIDSDAVFQLGSTLSDDTMKGFQNVLSEAQPSHCFVSSVNGPHLQDFQNQLQKFFPDIDCRVLTEGDIALSSSVQSRQKLGIDRLLAARAAVLISGHRPNESKPVIVIDAGTAVTIDLVGSSGVFQGGVILPGAETSFRSLHRSTGDLPDVKVEWSDVNLERVIGDSTESAILTGVVSAQAFSICGIVDRISSTLNDDPFIVASGGGIDPIRQLLPNEWHYVGHLVLRGIASVARSLDPSDNI